MSTSDSSDDSGDDEEELVASTVRPSAPSFKGNFSFIV